MPVNRKQPLLTNEYRLQETAMKARRGAVTTESLDPEYCGVRYSKNILIRKTRILISVVRLLLSDSHTWLPQLKQTSA